MKQAAITLNTAPVERGGQTHYLSRSDQFGTQRLGVLIEGAKPSAQAVETHVYAFADKPAECWLSLAVSPFSAILALSPAEAATLGRALINAAQAAEAAQAASTHLVGHT